MITVLRIERSRHCFNGTTYRVMVQIGFIYYMCFMLSTGDSVLHICQPIKDLVVYRIF